MRWVCAAVRETVRVWPLSHLSRGDIMKGECLSERVNTDHTAPAHIIKPPAWQMALLPCLWHLTHRHISRLARRTSHGQPASMCVRKHFISHSPLPFVSVREIEGNAHTHQRRVHTSSSIHAFIHLILGKAHTHPLTPQSRKGCFLNRGIRWGLLFPGVFEADRFVSQI